MVIIYRECNSWSCKSNSFPSAEGRCFSPDGSTLTRIGEYNKITGEQCSAFACIKVGVISLPILLRKKRALLGEPFYFIISMCFRSVLFWWWKQITPSLVTWLWACLPVGCWVYAPAQEPPFNAWSFSPVLGTWHVLAFKTLLSTFQRGNSHPVKPGGRKEWLPAMSSRRRIF